jgi:hypothetical protein
MHARALSLFARTSTHISLSFTSFLTRMQRACTLATLEALGPWHPRPARSNAKMKKSGPVSVVFWLWFEWCDMVFKFHIPTASKDREQGSQSVYYSGAGSGDSGPGLSPGKDNVDTHKGQAVRQVSLVTVCVQEKSHTPSPAQPEPGIQHTCPCAQGLPILLRR